MRADKPPPVPDICVTYYKSKRRGTAAPEIGFKRKLRAINCQPARLSLFFIIHMKGEPLLHERSIVS